MPMTIDCDRVALTAGVSQSILAPGGARWVTVGNVGPDDLQVYRDASDATRYVTIAASFERKFHLVRAVAASHAPAFALLAPNADATAVLIWE